MNSKKNFWRSFAGKGYYIALILCAVAIGISGYLYYRNANETPVDDPAVNVGNQNDPNVQAMATQPTGGNSGTEPGGSVTRTPIKTGMPVSGETVHGYAMDCLSYNPTTRDWRVHNGVDIAAEAGTAVCAAADGVVYTTYEDKAMGTTVVIRHEEGYVTKYASLAEDVLVSPGDSVEMGQAIGCVGTTALMENAIGDHVHFSITRNDESVDPEEFLNR